MAGGIGSDHAASQIPENGSGGSSSGGGASERRAVVEKTEAPKNVSIKNPTPIKIKMREKDGRQHALDEANNLMSKFKQQLSVSTKEVPSLGGGLKQITKFIKELDPKNTSGAVKPALDILDKLLKQGNSDPLKSIPGILGQLQQLLQQALNQIAKDNKKQNQPQEDPQCPAGQKWDKVHRTCVIDPKQQPPSFLSS